MRNLPSLALLSALALACDDKRDHGPALQPDVPTVGYRDDAASAAGRPERATTVAESGDAAPAAPAVEQPAVPPTSTTTVTPPPAQPAPTPPAVPVAQNVIVLSGAVGPKAIELSHPEGSPNPTEPRADLKARVVLDAGVLRYELYATAPAPWVVKSTTPFNLTLRPSNGVRLNKTIFTRNDFANPDLPVKQINAEIDAAPGEYAIDATAELYVCSAELCKRVNEKMRTEFTIPRS